MLTFESVARDATAMGAAGAAAQESAQSEGGGRAGVASNGQFPDLSRLGPLQLTFVSLQPCTNGGSSSDEGSKAGGDGSATALLEVAALRSTPDNTEGWCSVPGWPMRCVSEQPACTNLEVLLTVLLSRILQGVPTHLTLLLPQEPEPRTHCGRHTAALPGRRPTAGGRGRGG